MKKNQYIAPEVSEIMDMELELPIAQSLPKDDSEENKVDNPNDILGKDRQGFAGYYILRKVVRAFVPTTFRFY